MSTAQGTVDGLCLLRVDGAQLSQLTDGDHRVVRCTRPAGAVQDAISQVGIGESRTCRV
jgi:hypothetical protein